MPALAIGCGGGGSSGGTGWQRNPDWLAMPNMTEGIGQELFAAVYRVSNASWNPMLLKAAGNYTVDWGDGNVENFAANVVAEHNYAWGDCGGAFVDEDGITYRQALIQVYPQAGQTFTKLNLDQTNTFITNGPGWSAPPLLDVAVIGADLVDLCFSGFSAFVDAGVVYLFMTERIRVYENSITDGNNFFNYMCALESVYLNAAGWLSFENTFKECGPLVDVDIQNSGSVTTCATMFRDCKAMKHAPLFDTSAVTSFNNMFAGCWALISAPDYDTSNATDMAQVFNSSQSPAVYPAWDLSAAVDLSNVINGSPLTSRFLGYGATVSIYLGYGAFGRTELVEIFTNLGTAVGQIITVTGCYGVADLTAGDLLIATNKGWTVLT